MVKNRPANAGDLRDIGSIPGSGRPPKRKWQLIPVFLLEESHGQRSWVGSMSPRGLKESDMTEAIAHGTSPLYDSDPHLTTWNCSLRKVPLMRLTWPQLPTLPSNFISSMLPTQTVSYHSLSYFSVHRGPYGWSLQLLYQTSSVSLSLNLSAISAWWNFNSRPLSYSTPTPVQLSNIGRRNEWP